MVGRQEVEPQRAVLRACLAFEIQSSGGSKYLVQGTVTREYDALWHTSRSAGVKNHSRLTARSIAAFDVVLGGLGCHCLTQTSTPACINVQY